MSKNIVLTTAITGVVLLTLSSKAFADTTAPAAPSKPKTSSSWRDLPKQTLGVLTGIVVGLPVNCVRKPIDEEKYGIKEMNGDNHKPRVVIPAAVFYAPLALMAGVLESPWYAVNNSLLNYDKPFSKEQFSIVSTPPSPGQAEQPSQPVTDHK